MPSRPPSAYVRTGLVTAAVLALYWWAWQGVGFDLARMTGGLPQMGEFLARMFPPNVEVAQTVSAAALETLQIALVGTTLGAVGALPLGFLAAANISPLPVRMAVRTLLNVIRTIPLVLVAIFFVAAMGLGPLPGTLATAVYSVGMLGKFYAEAIEAIDPGQVEGVAATGATPLQVMRFGVLPQVLPLFVAYTLYRLEVNIREGTVLGLVGAGGIGFYISFYIRSFQYQKVATVATIILVMVVAIDLLSAWIRARIT
ncbi:MAG TPA: phosphonate ABC transporter, permease protein PhnE [Thermodesulfobacteriota bacterium]|nr:phosphonate ABC transporter, permease protein PhnE [Thermodesulfobacteriota bacterium]